jgi:hypothetical protein
LLLDCCDADVGGRVIEWNYCYGGLRPAQDAAGDAQRRPRHVVIDGSAKDEE